MKKSIIILLVFLTGFIGCKQKQVKEESTETTIEKKNANNVKDEINPLTNDWVKKIELDNGNKWSANNETTIGVNNMLTLISKSNPKNLEDYRVLAQKLNSEKNTLVKKCTMKGASHDNLHIFLHPLIEKINYLLKAESLEEANKTTLAIKENLETYQNYFY